MGTTFVVERQHLHALCSLSTPTSAEGGVEEKGGGKASCQIRWETEVQRLRLGWGRFYTSSHDFLCCNLSGNMTCFFSLHLWFGQLTNIISSWLHCALCQWLSNLKDLAFPQESLLCHYLTNSFQYSFNRHYILISKSLWTVNHLVVFMALLLAALVLILFWMWNDTNSNKVKYVNAETLSFYCDDI